MHDNNTLRRIRKMKGLTMEKLSEIAGISYVNLSQIERSEKKRFVASDNTIYKLSKALGIRPDLMFYSMGKLPPKLREEVAINPIFYLENINDIFLLPQEEKEQKRHDFVLSRYIFTKKGEYDEHE